MSSAVRSEEHIIISSGKISYFKNFCHINKEFFSCQLHRWYSAVICSFSEYEAASKFKTYKRINQYIYTHWLFMTVYLLKRPKVGCPILEFTLLHHSCLFSNCRLFEKTFTPIVLREVASVSIVKLKFTSNNSGSAFLIIDHMKILMTSVCVCCRS